MVFVLRKAGVMSAEYDNQISDRELAKFNGQFEVYAKEDNTFFDVITVANLAWDINKKNGWDEQAGIKIKIINENNEQVAYSVLPKQNLPKNNFFKGETGETSIYIYNGYEVSEKSMIDFYTQRKADNTDYIYKFKCTEIKYNDTTGKVSEMSFKIVKNK